MRRRLLTVSETKMKMSKTAFGKAETKYRRWLKKTHVVRPHLYYALNM